MKRKTKKSRPSGGMDISIDVEAVKADCIRRNEALKAMSAPGTLFGTFLETMFQKGTAEEFRNLCDKSTAGIRALGPYKPPSSK